MPYSNPAGHCSWLDIVHASPEPELHPLWQVVVIAQALADRVAAGLRREHFPSVIGGDPEAIRWGSDGGAWWASEVNVKRGIPPAIKKVGAGGTALRYQTIY